MGRKKPSSECLRWKSETVLSCIYVWVFTSSDEEQILSDFKINGSSLFFCNTTCTFPKRDLSFPRIYHQWKLQCGLMNNFFSKVRVQQYLSANKNLHLWIKREKCFKLFLITKPVATSSHEIITKQQWWNCILKCDKKTSWRPSAGHISKIRRPK